MEVIFRATAFTVEYFDVKDNYFALGFLIEF